MATEFHTNPFDEETITKLRLFQSYIRKWLPVFMVNSSRVNEIWLFDLFCGPGCDCDDVKGSPLILLDELAKYLNIPTTKHPPKINVVFNDYKQWKIDKLQKLIATRPQLPNIVSIHFRSDEYKNVFPRVAEIAKRNDTACFIFIDQCGVNAIEDTYLMQLASFPVTDWLAFVASGQARRFIEHESIKFQLVERGKWRDAHRTVADTCRLIINKPGYYIVPFSIKKRSNIHGLIFGSPHPSGAEKFINGCWDIDKNAGEANFDIEGDIKNSSNMLKLFSKKLDAFEEEFRRLILSKAIGDTKEAYEFTLQSGVKTLHARNVLQNMKKEGLISKTPSLSYDTTIKKKNIQKIPLNK